MRKYLILALALVAFAAGSAHAQAVSPYSWDAGTAQGKTAVGVFVPVVNAVDSVLYDGEVVMVDTTAATGTNVKRIAVRRYSGTLSDRFRIIGVVAQTQIAKSSQRGTGRVLIWGYHPAVYVGVSNAGAKAPLKAGAVMASLSVADSVSMAVGYVIGGVAGTSTVNTGPRYRYRVFWTGVGGRIVGSL